MLTIRARARARPLLGRIGGPRPPPGNEGQRVVESFDLPLLRLVHLTDVGFHNSAKFIVVESVHAVVGFSVKAPAYLVVRARARIEARHAVVDGPFDRAVVAGVEVQGVHPLKGTPVATHYESTLLQEKRHGHRLLGLLLVERCHEEQPVTESIVESLKELSCQIFGSPRTELSVGFGIEVIHQREIGSGDFIPGERLDGDALVRHGLALPANVSSLVLIKDRQVIIKGLISGILPRITLMKPAAETQTL